MKFYYSHCVYCDGYCVHLGTFEECMEFIYYHSDLGKEFEISELDEIVEEE